MPMIYRKNALFAQRLFYMEFFFRLDRQSIDGPAAGFGSHGAFVDRDADFYAVYKSRGL